MTSLITWYHGHVIVLVYLIHVSKLFVQTQDVESLGCWKDLRKKRALISMEHKNHLLDGPYSKRSDPVRKCAQVAIDHGYPIFAVQNGGQCFSGSKAEKRYDMYGPSNLCNDGKGGKWSNNVYSTKTSHIRSVHKAIDPSPWDAYCSRDLDIVLLLDSSGTINKKNKERWKEMKKFCWKFMKGFDEHSRFGVIRYGSDPDIIVDLMKAKGQEQITEELKTLDMSGGKRTLNDGLKRAWREQLKENNRSAADKVVIAMTTGDVPYGLYGSSQFLSDHGVRVIAIGIDKNVHYEFLQSIASYRDVSNIFSVNSEQLQEVAPFIYRDVCNSMPEYVSETTTTPAPPKAEEPSKNSTLNETTATNSTSDKTEDKVNNSTSLEKDKKNSTDTTSSVHNDTSATNSTGIHRHEIPTLDDRAKKPTEAPFPSAIDEITGSKKTILPKRNRKTKPNGSTRKNVVTAIKNGASKEEVATMVLVNPSPELNLFITDSEVNEINNRRGTTEGKLKSIMVHSNETLQKLKASDNSSNLYNDDNAKNLNETNLNPDLSHNQNVFSDLENLKTSPSNMSAADTNNSTNNISAKEEATVDKKIGEKVNVTTDDEILKSKKIKSDKDYSVFDNLKENKIIDDKDENLLSSVRQDNHLDEDTMESINAPSLSVLDNTEPTQDYSKHKALKAIDTSTHNKDVSKGAKLNGSLKPVEKDETTENDQDPDHNGSLGSMNSDNIHERTQKTGSKNEKKLKKYSSQTIEDFSSDQQSKFDDEPQPLLEAPKQQGVAADAKTFDISDEGKAADSKIAGPGIVSQTLELHQGNGKEHVSEHPPRHVDFKNLFSGKLNDRWKSHEVKSMKPMFSDRAKIVEESQQSYLDPKLELKNITGWQNATTLLDSAGKELAEIYHKVHDGKNVNDDDKAISQTNQQTINANTTITQLMGNQPSIYKFSRGNEEKPVVIPFQSSPAGPSVFEMDEEQQPDQSIIRNLTAQKSEVRPTSSTEAIKYIYKALHINPHGVDDKFVSHSNFQTPLIKPQLINTSTALRQGEYTVQPSSNRAAPIINNFNAKVIPDSFGSSVRPDINNTFITLNVPNIDSNQSPRNISNQVLSDTKNLLRNNLAVDFDAFHQGAQQTQNGVETNAKIADRSTKKHELKMQNSTGSSTNDNNQSSDLLSMKSLVGAVEQVSKNAAVLAHEEAHSRHDQSNEHTYSNAEDGPRYDYDDDQMNDEQTRKMLQERKGEIDRLLKLLDEEDKKRLSGQVRSTNRHTIEPNVLTAEAKELRKAFDQINKRIRSLHNKKQSLGFESNRNTFVYHEPTLSYYTAPSHYGDFGDFQRPITGRIDLGGGSIPFVSEEIGNSVTSSETAKDEVNQIEQKELHATQYQYQASKKFERQNPDIDADVMQLSDTSNKKQEETNTDGKSAGKNEITDTERSNHRLLKFKPAIIPSESSASVSSIQQAPNQKPKVTALTFVNQNAGQEPSNGNANNKKLPSKNVKTNRASSKQVSLSKNTTIYTPTSNVNTHDGFNSRKTESVVNEKNTKAQQKQEESSKSTDQSDQKIIGTGKSNGQKIKSNFANKENDGEKTRKVVANKENVAEKTRKIVANKENNAEKTRKIVANKGNDAEKTRKVVANKENDAEKTKKISKGNDTRKTKHIDAKKENDKEIKNNMTKTDGKSSNSSNSHRIKTTALTIDVDNIDEMREKKKQKLLKTYADHVNKIILNRTKLINKKESGSDTTPSSLSTSKHNKNILQKINSLVASLEPEEDENESNLGNRKHIEEKEKKDNKTSSLDAREKTARQPQYQYYPRDPNALRSVYPSPSRPLTPFNMSKLPFSNPGSFYTGWNPWNTYGIVKPDITSSYTSSHPKNVIKTAGPSIGAFANEEITRSGNIVNSFIKNEHTNHPMVTAYKEVGSMKKLTDSSSDITSKYQHLNLNTLSRKSKAPKLKKRRYDKPFSPDIPSAQETAALQMKPLGAIKPIMSKRPRPPLKPHHPKGFDSLFEHVRKEKISNDQHFKRSKEKNVPGVKKSTKNITTPLSTTLQWARMEIRKNSNYKTKKTKSGTGSWTEKDFTAKVGIPLSRVIQGNVKSGVATKANSNTTQVNAKGNNKLMSTFRKILLASAASSEKDKNREKPKHQQKDVKSFGNAAIQNYNNLNSKLQQIKDTLAIEDSSSSATSHKSVTFKGIPKYINMTTEHRLTDASHTNRKEDNTIQQSSKKRFLGMRTPGSANPVTERDVYNVPSYWNIAKNYFTPSKSMYNIGHTNHGKANSQVSSSNAFSQVANELYRVRKLYNSRRQSAEAKMNSVEGKKGKKNKKIQTDSAKKESINTNVKDIDMLNLDNDKLESNWKELITGDLDKDIVSEDETFKKQADTSLSFSKPNKKDLNRYWFQTTPSMSKQILKSRLKMSRSNQNVIKEIDFPRKFSINEFRLSDLPALPKGKSYVLSTPSLGTVLVKIRDDLDEDSSENDEIKKPLHGRHHHQTLIDFPVQKSTSNEKSFFPSNKSFYLTEHQLDSANKAIEGKRIPSLVSYIGNSVSRHRNMTPIQDPSPQLQNEEAPVIAATKDPLTGILRSSKSLGNIEHDTVDFSKADTYDNLEESLIRDRSQKIRASLLPTGKRSQSIFYDDSTINTNPGNHNDVSELENEGLINMVHSVLKESPEESKNFLKHKGNSILSQAFAGHDSSVAPANETGLSLLIQKIHSLNQQINDANNHTKTPNAVGKTQNPNQDGTGFENKVGTPFHKDNSHQMDSDDDAELSKSTKTEQTIHKPVNHVHAEEDKLTRIFESDTTESHSEEVTPVPDKDMMGLTVNHTITNQTHNSNQIDNKTKGIGSENMTKHEDTKPIKSNDIINMTAKNLTSKINPTDDIKQNTSTSNTSVNTSTSNTSVDTSTSNASVNHTAGLLANTSALDNSSMPINISTVVNSPNANLIQNTTLQKDIKGDVAMLNSTHTVNGTEEVKIQNVSAKALEHTNATRSVNATADGNDTSSMSSLEYTLGCSKPLRILYAIDVSDGLGAGPLRQKRWKRLKGFINDINNDVIPGVRHSFMVYNVEPRFLKSLETCDKDTEYFMTADECLCSKKISIPNSPGCSVNNPTESENVEDWGRSGPRTGQALERARKKFFDENLHHYKNIIFLISHKDSVDSLDKPENDLKQDGISLVDIELGDRHDLKRKRDYIAHAHLKNSKKSTIGDSNNNNDEHKMKVSLKKLQTTLRNIVGKVCKANTDDEAKKKSLVHNED